MNMSALLNTALLQNHLQINDEAKKKFLVYLELLQTWNRVFNLTSITDPKEMVYLHLIDSLVVAPYVTGQTCLDVGTGAGLPGIPLAILNPTQTWVLLDKNSKKTRFLTQAIAELGLKNISVVHRRSEDFHPSHCFDSILSRALGTLAMFVTSTAHLLCPNGSFIAMKGKTYQDEIAALPKTVAVTDITRLDIQGINIERHLVRLRKL